jgi:hypothetical protein
MWEREINSLFTTWRKLITECAILATLSFSVLFVYWNGNIPIIIIIIIIVFPYHNTLCVTTIFTYNRTT